MKNRIIFLKARTKVKYLFKHLEPQLIYAIRSSLTQGDHARVLSQPEVPVLETVPGHGLVSHVPVVGVVHEHGSNVGIWHLPLYVTEKCVMLND